MTSAISAQGLEKRLTGGEAAAVGVGEDNGEEGGELFPHLSSFSLSTLPPSPSSWQKVDREPAFLPTNLMNMTCIYYIGLDDPHKESVTHRRTRSFNHPF